MVISAENTQRPPDPMSETAAPARSLHNFSSFPILKTWGHRKVLRCLNVNRKGQIIGSHRTLPPASSSPSSSLIPSKEEMEEDEEEEDDDEGLEKVRAKLLVHLQEAADKINIVTTSPPATEKEPEPVPFPPPSSSSSPWNLRARKTAPARDAGSSSPPHAARPAPAGPNVRTVRLRSEVAEKKERSRFSISLSMREIDEDIYAVTGTRARRRPRKRPRVVQKQLDMLFPGSWLTEITADTYKVPE